MTPKESYRKIGGSTASGRIEGTGGENGRKRTIGIYRIPIEACDFRPYMSVRMYRYTYLALWALN